MDIVSFEAPSGNLRRLVKGNTKERRQLKLPCNTINKYQAKAQQAPQFLRIYFK